MIAHAIDCADARHRTLRGLRSSLKGLGAIEESADPAGFLLFWRRQGALADGPEWAAPRKHNRRGTTDRDRSGVGRAIRAGKARYVTAVAGFPDESIPHRHLAGEDRSSNPRGA